MQLDVECDPAGPLFGFGGSRRGSVDSLGILGCGSAGGSDSGRGDGGGQFRDVAQGAMSMGPAVGASVATAGGVAMRMVVAGAGTGADAATVAAHAGRRMSLSGGESAGSGRGSKRSGSSDSGRSLTYVQLTEGLRGTPKATAAVVAAAGTALSMDIGELPNGECN